MDIRKHRFVPTVSTTTKVFAHGKRKAQTRRRLNAEVRKMY